MTFKTENFPVSPALTAIAVRYSNPATSLIADEVLPYIPPVGTLEFKYFEYDMAEAFTLPDTKVGAKSQPNEVEFSAVERTASCQDHGLDDVVANLSIQQAAASAQHGGAAYRPLDHATQGLTELIQLGREVRAANLVFNPASYRATLRSTLAGATQWSHADSDPAAAILEALDKTLVFRPNILVLGKPVWTALRQNANMVKKVLGSASTSGLLTRRQVADALELEDVLVGESYLNVAKRGQAADVQRVWGKHASLIHRNKMANTERGVTFGFTARCLINGQERMAGTMPEPKLGLRGSTRVRVGESVRELVICPDVGYHFHDAVA
jgi:hypothetical protein